MVLLCRSRLPYSPIFRLIAVAFLLEPLSAFVSNAAALLGIDYMYFVKSALEEMPPTHAIPISILDCTSNTSQPVQWLEREKRCLSRSRSLARVPSIRACLPGYARGGTPKGQPATSFVYL